MQKDGTFIAHSNKDYVLKANLLNGQEFDASVHQFAVKVVGGGTGFADYLNNG